MQGDEGDRCVGAGDQEVNRDMIESAEGAEWSLGDGQQVIETAGAVEQYQSGAIDRKGRQLPRAAGHPEEKDGASARE